MLYPEAEKISLVQAKAYLQQLDLSYIAKAMCSTDYPLPRWTLSDALHCCAIYKNFLFLQKKHFPAFLVPTKEIDEYWHNHILHTRKYFLDCLHIFGHYLHHEPVTEADNDNIDILVKNYVNTKKLYLAEFKQPMNGFLSGE